MQGGGLWVFFSFIIFFRTTWELEYFFFVEQSAQFFSQNLTLGYMTITLNQIIIFFLHQNQNIFSATLEIRIFFLEKNHSPPSWKLNGPSLTVFVDSWNINYIERKTNSHKPTSAYNLPSTCKCLLPKQSIANCNGPLKIYFYIGWIWISSPFGIKHIVLD